MKIRRSRYLRFEITEDRYFDPAALLRGELVIETAPRLVVFSGLAGCAVDLSLVDLELLLSLSAEEWTEAEDLDESADRRERIDSLASDGVVLVDSDEFRHFAELHERLDAMGWDATALTTFLENRVAESEAFASNPHDDISEKLATADRDADAYVEKRGEPPEAFAVIEGRGKDVELPLGSTEGNFERILLERRTCRAFAADPLPLADFSTLLRLAFGCQGLHRLGSRFVSLQKTSPSGGSMHPIEAFPVVLNVEGLESGLYHYRVDRHALTPIEQSARDRLAKQVVAFAQGQTFVGDAHAVVVLVARFARNFWKYPRRLNTYHVLWVDAGHLGQTFQLLSTRLGLGAFYTGALAPEEIGTAFGLEARELGPLGLCGVGLPAKNDPTRLPFEPFEPIRD